MRNLLIGGSIILAFVTLAFASIASDVLNAPEEGSIVSINGAHFFVSVADTEKERRQGLSESERIALDRGLLFVFPSDDLHGIWMSGMRFAIDVIWFDKDMKVVGLKERFAPDSFPQVAYPEAPARFVLEVHAGLIDEYNIRLGDMGELRRMGL